MSSTSAIPSNEAAGIIIVVVFAAVSLVALSAVAARVFWLVVVPLLRRDKSVASPREIVFFRTQLGTYAACLLVACAVSCVSGLMQVPWLMGMKVEEGIMCTTQGILSETSNIAVAFFTVTIGIHTFTSLVLERRQSTWLGRSIIALGWVSALAVGIVPAMLPSTSGPGYGITGMSCGMSNVYNYREFGFHLAPIFIASILSTIIYALTFLVLRGTLVIKGGLKLQLSPKERWSGRVGNFEEYHRFIRAIARTMLWYPFAYTVALAPYCIVRLGQFSNVKVSSALSIFASCCWYSLGLANVVLVSNTFRHLEPAFSAAESTNGVKDTEKAEKTFGTSEEKSYKSFDSSATLDAPALAYHNPARETMSFPVSPLPATSRIRSLTHQKSNSTASFRSNSRLLTGHRSQSPSLSLNSVGSVAESFTSVDTLQRSITPVAELNRQLGSSPEPSIRSNSSESANGHGGLTVRTEHIRQGSTESLGLPVPPRYTRSPISRRPTLTPVRSTFEEPENLPRMSFGAQPSVPSLPSSPHAMPASLAPGHRLRPSESFYRETQSRQQGGQLADRQSTAALPRGPRHQSGLSF